LKALPSFLKAFSHDDPVFKKDEKTIFPLSPHAKLGEQRRPGFAQKKNRGRS